MNRRTLRFLLVFTLLSLLPTSLPPRAASQTPQAIALCPGDATAFEFPVFLPSTPLQADILLAFDTTFSMVDVIDGAQRRASELLTALATLIEDPRFGVIDFRDYPIPPFGAIGDWPYRLAQPLTDDTARVLQEIRRLHVGGGGNYPEAYTRVLYESYSDPDIAWRPGARRFLIVFGDDVPHDDDLNAGVPDPPRTDVWWTTEDPPPRDPGRDGELGTEDDLDFQPTLAALREHGITLLYVSGAASPMREPALTTEELVYYWRYWARLTGPGGDAVPLEETGELATTIRDLVATAMRYLNRLTVEADPETFTSWVMADPPAFTAIEIPPQGTWKTFRITVTVPPGTLPGRYAFQLRAVGDGSVYATRQNQVEVPTPCFASPTLTPTVTPTPVPLPTPHPRWTVLLPLVVRNWVH